MTSKTETHYREVFGHHQSVHAYMFELKAANASPTLEAWPINTKPSRLGNIEGVA